MPVDRFFRTLLSIAVAPVLVTTLAHAAPPELRGTWVTTTGNDAISTPAKTDATMKRLADIGLNTVYVECWKNGYTEFPSDALKKAIGVEMKVNGHEAPQRDLLAETTLAAHRNGLLCVAWFEYGFMAAFKDTQNELRAKKDWITVDRAGDDVGKKNGFAWLNPFHPDVQQFLIDIAIDAIKSHDIDGVQLDDRIALPVDLGYDPYTRALYKKETGKDVPDDFKDVAWMRWRADKISAFALRYVAALRDANPELIISVSPAPAPWGYDNYLCDWVEWTKWCQCRGHHWDEFIPQTYRLTGAATTQSVREQIDQVGDAKSDLAAGIRVVGDGPDMPFADVRATIDFCRQQRLEGHVLWFSRGVLDVYASQFAALYDVAKNGRAPNPIKAYDWRPLPIVATRVGDAWHATVKTPGRYAVLTRAAGVWHATKTIDAVAGDQVVEATGDAVELLVDRRPE